MKILIVVGTRPNFIKVTQFKRIVEESYPDINLKIVHTGQHYDEKMANVFFDQFQLRPDFYLNIKPAKPIHQIAEIMVKLEDLVDQTFWPQLIIVPGDVNSTLAAALVANKKKIKLAHLESGLRSFDKDMPEEWNRLLVDEMADFYFVTEQSGLDYLQKENKQGKAYFVGNTMIDTMLAFEEKIQASRIIQDLNINKKFTLLTIHRPSNVDSLSGIKILMNLLEYLNKCCQVVFPIHPRTRQKITEFEFDNRFLALENIVVTEPLGYFDFQKLISSCLMVLTDSGGIQEETTYRGVPCLTLRNNTERPITIVQGTNTLVPFDFDIIQKYIDQIFEGKYKNGEIPRLWDGRSSYRIMNIINSLSL